MGNGKLRMSMRVKELREMFAYCERNLIHQFGPEEGRSRLGALPFTEALQMWRRRDMN